MTTKKDKDGVPLPDPASVPNPPTSGPPTNAPAPYPDSPLPYVPGEPGSRPVEGVRPTVMDDVDPSKERQAEQSAKNADLERSQREGQRGPVINDEVMFVKDILVGHITAIHSDGSVDIIIGSSMVHTSVPHISKVKDPATTLNTKGWYSRQHDRDRYDNLGRYDKGGSRQVDTARGPGPYDDGRRAADPSADSPYTGPALPVGGQHIGDRPGSDRLVNDRDKGPSDVRPATERDKPYTERP